MHFTDIQTPPDPLLERTFFDTIYNNKLFLSLLRILLHPFKFQNPKNTYRRRRKLRTVIVSVP